MGLLDHFVVKTLPLVPKPVVARLSKPYIAGDSIVAAVECIRQLNRKGIKATIDVLGEFVTDFSHAERSLKDYQEALAAILEHDLDANLSVKPTSFGLLLNRDRCREMLAVLMRQIADAGHFLRLDMEDSPCTSATFDLYDYFREKYGQGVGVAVQSYMRRTLPDVRRIIAKGPAHFRLCKGIYVEPEAIAFKEYQEVRDNFVTSLEAMFEGGAFVGIATHDEWLVAKSEELIKAHGLGPEHYEFQMLLGVREKLRDQILDRGHNMRIYVPYGHDWYGYSVRRLKENPALAGTMFKAIVFRQ